MCNRNLATRKMSTTNREDGCWPSPSSSAIIMASTKMFGLFSDVQPKSMIDRFVHHLHYRSADSEAPQIDDIASSSSLFIENSSNMKNKNTEQQCQEHHHHLSNLHHHQYYQASPINRRHVSSSSVSESLCIYDHPHPHPHPHHHYHYYYNHHNHQQQILATFWRWTLSLILALVLSHGGRALSFPYDDTEIIGTLTGVAGGKIALPCNISTSTPKDSVTLILWYKDESTTPIYSVDARKGVSLEAARRVTDENLASRAYMNTGTSPYAHLMLELLTPEDAGEYACRVDFRKERTRNSVIFLKIIVPPEKPQIVDSTGESLPSLIGPYNEGDRLELVCEVEGGKPIPSLTWWRESVLLDDTYEQLTTPNGNTLVRNQLVIPSLSRQDLMAVFTCQASNNNISLPSTATVTVDLNFRPLTVKILGERRQSLSAGKVSIIVCESTGSRPPATISWWLGGDGTKLRNAQEQISADGNKTTSRLSLTVTIDDLGKELTCRAENPHVQASSIEDSIQLDINYPPQVTLKLGSNLRHSHIQEGNDVYFECLIRASPSSYDVRWHFEGRELQTNTSAGIIVSNQSLVLQKVKRQQRGKYTCSATNSEGEGESNPVHLRVQYAPFCKTGQKIIYGAARHETVNILCELEADPAEVEFFWSYNGTGQEPRRETATLKYESSNTNGGGALASIGHYTPHTEFDYGTIYCWGRNAVGVQSKPCAFSIVAAGSPDPVRNCSVFNITEDSMRVECQEGYDGGLQQSFLLEIYDTTERNSALRANLTSPVPQFQLNQLQPAHTYLFVIYAINAKGRSKGIALTAFTLAMPESMNRLAKGNVWQLNFNPSLVVLIAVVTGLVLIAFFIVLIVRWRTMKPSNHHQRHAPCIQANSGGAANVHNRFDCSDNKLNHVGGDNPLLDKEKSSSNESNNGGQNNNNNGSSSQTTTNSTILSSDMSSNNTTGLFRKSGSGVPVHEEAFSEITGDPLTGKNATDLDLDLMLTQNDQIDTDKLTIPLNGQTTGTGTMLTSGGQMGQAQQIIRSNIYSSVPAPPPLLSQNGASTTMLATTPLANNKHVSWRPATPPSPTPNIYTQYHHIGYMPLPTIGAGNDTFHMIATHHPLTNANLIPYPLSSNNNNNYETTAFLDGPAKLSAQTTNGDGGYLIDTTNNHTVPAHSLPPYDVLMNSSTNIPPHPLQHHLNSQQNPYAAAAAACGGNLQQQQQQQMPPTYGTIPRRVRVIPTMMGMGVPGHASSMASSSSGGSIGTSAAASSIFHPHQQQHSIPTGTATPTNVSTSNNTLVVANDATSQRSSPMTDV